MKKMFIAVLVFATTLVNAAEVTVLETELYTGMDSYNTYVQSSFYMDQQTGEGYVKVSVVEQYSIPNTDPRGPWNRNTVLRQIFQDTVKVEGLELVGDKVIFTTPEREVDCGTMGVSRVFKRPTIYLSGNCDLRGRTVGHWHKRKLVVTLKTK
jgi:hypothetical protein